MEEMATRESRPDDLPEGVRRVFFVGIHYKLDTPALCPSTKSGKLINQAWEFLRADLCAKIVFRRTNLFTGFSVPDDYKVGPYVPYWVMDNEFIQEEDIVVALGGLVGDLFLHAQKVGIITHLIRRTHPSAVWSTKDKTQWFLDLERCIEEIVKPYPRIHASD